MICGKTKKNMYGLYDSNCRFILQKLHFMQKYALKNAKYAKYAAICGKMKNMRNMREIEKYAIFCINMRSHISKVLIDYVKAYRPNESYVEV